MKDRILRRILGVLDTLSARIRHELQSDEPARRPTTVLEARSLWRTPYLANLIRSPLYRGEWQYGKDHHKRIDTPQGIKNQVSRGTEVISVQVPAIVTDSLWQLANEQLLENRKKFYRKTKREYLLRGRLRCGVCGMKMSGNSGYYKCRLKDCEHRADPAHNCDNGYVWYEAADEAVWSTVRDAMLDENRLWVAVNRRSEEALKVREALETSLTAMQLRIQREQDKIGRLLDLYAAGDLDREIYLAKCKTIEDGITSISVQAQDLEKRLAENPVILPDQEEALRIFQREISSRMTGDVPMAEKRKLLDLLRVEASWDSRTKQLSITGLVVDAVLSVSR